MISGLNIWRRHELWCRSQTELRSQIAVAVVQADGYSSDLTPSWEPPCAVGEALKSGKKKGGDDNFQGLGSFQKILEFTLNIFLSLIFCSFTLTLLCLGPDLFFRSVLGPLCPVSSHCSFTSPLSSRWVRCTSFQSTHPFFSVEFIFVC